MSVECPVCHTSNPAGAPACQKCLTPIDLGGATQAIEPDTLFSSDSTSGFASTGSRWANARADSYVDGSHAVGPGSLLAGRYEILALLGEGGMGSVFKSRDIELDRIVALKLIRPELANNAEILRRFKQEIVLARQITHRNVIRIFDLVLAEGRKFITMQFVEGRDLMRAIVDRGKFPPEEAVGIFKQALLGLEVAHQEGVVHRDLKPHNIMLDTGGKAYLMDFGIARSIEAVGMTRTGVLMGTPDYMSPEQARGERADARSDLFSMGVILFEMLTGKLPYQAATPMGALVKRTQERAPSARQFDASIPEYLDAIVARCLERNPDKRYESASAILQDLDSEQNPNLTRVDADRRSLAGLAPGTAFGPRYEIEQLIGEGAMGSVYKARDRDLDRTVALKLVRPELAGNTSSMERLKQEILLASRISHKHILRTHDLGDVDGVKFISLAYVEGQDLHQLIRSHGTLPVEQALDIGKQICQALEAAHGEGVVHRDLKPQNVLVNGEGQAFVSDFGIATSLEAGTSGEMLGTPRYMPPEQIEGLPVDHRADLYALGLILYEMVTGDLPFASETVMQAMFQRVTQAPRNPKLLNPDLPDDFTAVILKAIEKDPNCRYQSAREMLNALEGVGKAALVPATTPASRSLRKPLWIAAAAAVAGLALVFAIPASRNKVLSWSGVGADGETYRGPARYLAVLPLRVSGDDPQLALAADGITEALSTRLGQLKAIHLASPTAAARVNQQDSLQKIAHSLGAKLILYGTIYRQGDKLQIVLSLNEPETGQRQWTHQFTGLQQDILVLQDEIYNQLISVLGLKLTSEEMARGVSRPTDDIDAWGSYLKGRSLLRGKRDTQTMQQALDLFEQASKRDPNFALAYTGTADASLAMYDLTKDAVWTNRALGAANRAEQINDKLPEVHFSLGSVYNATGRTAQAIAELKHALELAPNSDEAYRRIGRAYLNSGRNDEASKAFQKAVDSNPYYWLNQNLLGIAQVEASHYDAALGTFRKVTEIDPNRASAWENLGSVYHYLGKPQESVNMYRKAAGLQPSDETYSNLGAGLYFLGKCDEAANYFQKALDLSPNDYTSPGNLAGAYTCLGQKSKADEMYDRAIKLALQALQVNPKQAAILGTLGTYYAHRGDHTRALEYARRARSVDPKSKEAMYQQAVVFTLTGDSRQALNGLKEAIDSGYPASEAATDPDLKSLQKDPVFQQLVKRKG